MPCYKDCYHRLSFSFGSPSAPRGRPLLSAAQLCHTRAPSQQPRDALALLCHDPPCSSLQLPAPPPQQSIPPLPWALFPGHPSPVPHASPHPGCSLSAKSPWAERCGSLDRSWAAAGTGKGQIPMAKTFWEKNRFPPNNRDIRMRAST